MIAWLRNIALYGVCAVAATGVTSWMDSPLADKILENLSAIVLALLAINVQTTAVIAVKLREVLDKTGGQANATIGQFRLAIIEQALLLLAALFVQAVVDAKAVQPPEHLLEVSCFFIFFAALHVFLDTTIGLLIALFPDDASGFKH